MANPRIEEVEDDEDIGDPEEMDLDSFDFARPQGTLGQASSSSSTGANPSLMDPQALASMLSGNTGGTNAQRPSPQHQPQMSDRERDRIAHEQREKAKHYQCLYPVYFDSSRSREDGRRVKKEDAVENPLAREIVEALHNIGQTLGIALNIVFEPSKCHPKDWANPGRVKVLVKKDGNPVNAKIANSTFSFISIFTPISRRLSLTKRSEHYLLRLVATYLQSHPTTSESPLKLRIPGLPAPKSEELAAVPAIPRGFKMGTILPLHSPARSGGGVSDNFFKEMMEEMGGNMPEGMQGMANMAGMAGGGGGGPKKIRVKQRR